MSTPTRTATRYSVRAFDPADRATFLSMYETVFGRERSADWFRWKFRENPFVDHVPIIVASDDGDPVGFRSFFAQELRAGDAVLPAFQPCDTMVHPDHRNRGLFDRLNERAIERYSDGSPSFFFNFPNEHSKRGNRKHGWREIGTIPAYYRLQNPANVLERVAADRQHAAESPSRAGERGVAGTVADGMQDVVVATHRLGDRLIVDSEAALEIERATPPPADTLAAVYRRSIPDTIHANRTAAFYRWRFDNPAQTYTSYVARRDGEPVAALVVSSADDHVRLVDTLPRTLDGDTAALESLLVAALDDFADRSYVEAFGETLPAPLRFRFYPDTQAPLSTVLRPTSRTLFARNLADEIDVESSSAATWTFSRLELDTT
ncbi:GNAT family N-acetyltransferase [Haloarchaeobius amylolyticus]|uniref:GNAT family N-acetyltransferase n=1 Tax=Haloarchaeobius amylolyticus TaxID=1198296 RepID=A0ABD6BH73_9EURY